MAFSYSDKNFTVVGNLCFVHIILDGKARMIDIPPAIVDRILYPEIFCNYPYISSKASRGSGTSTRGIGYAMINNTIGIGYATIANSKIYLSDLGEGYLSFFFPIDSNK